MTNLLYVLAKFKFVPDLISGKPNEKHYNVSDSLFMTKCTEILKKEVVLPLPIVGRNLWNFYALKFYDNELFDKFAKIIVKNS